MHNYRHQVQSSLKTIITITFIFLPLLAFSQEFWSSTGSIPASTDAFRLTTDSQNRIFVGVNGVGVFVSSDGGSTWINRGLPGQNFMDLTINTSDDVFVTAGHQLYRSSNQGITWQDISNGLPDVATQSIAFDGEGRMFVGLYGEMIYRSIDNGNSWEALSTGLSNQTVYVSMAVNSRGFIYAGTNGAHIYRSLNHGDSWQRLITGLSSPEVWALEIDSEDRIFAGTGNGICISNDGGTSWSLAPQTEGNFDVNDMTINADDHIFATNYYGGVWRTVDHGNTWESISDPATGEVSWGLTMDSQGYLFCGAGNGQVYRSTQPTMGSTTPFVPINAGLQAMSSSSIEWGDYDNDGDLDILMVGLDDNANYARIYRNDGAASFVEVQTANLQAVVNGPVTWGDYDNDGDLDILMTGYDGGSTNFSILYRNDGYGNDGAEIFTDQTIDLTPMGSGSVEWVDYDNDGDLDIFMSGWNGSTSFALIYRNDDGTFSDINAGLPGVRSGGCPWGDYDNDGDLDLLLTGWDGTSRYSQIFQNTNGTFSDIGADLTLVAGAAAWGDYDSDGDLDILLAGYADDTSYETILYQNNAGLFVEVSVDLPGINRGTVDWGDYDNDGDLDLLLTGNNEGVFLADIYQNDAGDFAPIQAGLQVVRNSAVAWGDYDGDGDLDILLTGHDGANHHAIIYRNDIERTNTVPSAPGNLSNVVTSSSVTLSWNPSADIETANSALTYSIRIGSSFGADDVKTAQANLSSGLLKTVAMGNVQQVTSWTIKDLAGGTYYWSVQAIDNAFAGSQFSTEQSFEIGVTPVATTDAASAITTTTVALNGTINPNGFSTEVVFEYGPTSAYGNQIAATPSTVNGTTAVGVVAGLENLLENTEYHFRVVATSIIGTTYGDDQSFNTLLDNSLPTATTDAATAVSATTVTLNGTVNPSDLSTEVVFEYGLSDDYGSQITAVQSPLSGSVSVAVSADLTGLTADQKYHFRVVATNSMGTTYGSDQFFVMEPAGNPPTVITDAATEVTVNSARLNGTVNPGDQITSVLFVYGLTANYDSQIEVTNEPLVGTADLEVSVSLTELFENTEYHYRLVASNASGSAFGDDQTFTTLLNYPATLTLNSPTTTFPSYDNAEDYAVTDYRLVGLPGSSDVLASTLLEGNQGEDWELYWDNGNTEDYLVQFDGDSDFNCSVGRAFWLINKGSFDVNTSVNSAPLNGVNQIELPLHSGWNLITNPIVTSLSWNSIQALNGIGDPIWSYAGSFSTTDDFESFQGYYYFNGDDRSLLQIPYQELSLGKSASDTQDVTQWELGLVLTSGEQEDRSARLGVATDALAGLDRYDYRKPRSVGDQASVTFYRPSWDKANSAFASDIRPAGDGPEQWEFVLENLANETTQLFFAGLDQLPAELAAYLINTQDGSTVDLRENPGYEFVPAHTEINFVISIGDKEQVQDYLTSISPATPFIGKNYPNPFNPTTTLSYALPETAHMSLVVYDIQGNMVKILRSGQYASGWYEQRWDGVNEAGQAVSAGLYFARLQTGLYSKTIKMLLIK